MAAVPLFNVSAPFCSEFLHPYPVQNFGADRCSIVSQWGHQKGHANAHKMRTKGAANAPHSAARAHKRRHKSAPERTRAHQKRHKSATRAHKKRPQKRRKGAQTRHRAHESATKAHKKAPQTSVVTHQDARAPPGHVGRRGHLVRSVGRNEEFVAGTEHDLHEAPGAECRPERRVRRRDRARPPRSTCRTDFK